MTNSKGGQRTLLAGGGAVEIPNNITNRVDVNN